MKRELDEAGSLVSVTADFEELKEHGDLEYPVGAYLVSFDAMHMGYVGWHWHDEMEISLIKSGQAEFAINDETFILSEGQAIFINKNSLHAVHPIETKNCIYVTIVFQPFFLFGHGHTKMAATYLTPVSSHPDLRYVLFDGTETFHKDIVTMLEEIFSLNLHKPFGYEIYTRNALSSFWILLLEHIGKTASPLSIEKSGQLTLDESRTRKAILYIQKHYNDTISLDDIAASIHVSKGECCRCFKRSMNLTPFEYLMKYRIFMAAGTIRNNPSLSMATLASSVGFNSSSYFNKLFRKYLNCTPTEYRSNLRNGHTPASNYNGYDLTLDNIRLFTLNETNNEKD
ncbi:MAG: AraC family transcriptional regulator [Lachnospiraceae bacterium]|nr:AraC family transcriptional regulator [Lachnospiraceae bacterium]